MKQLYSQWNQLRIDQGNNYVINRINQGINQGIYQSRSELWNQWKNKEPTI